jgi:RimJ/RimL family protein N-acetyltransferase
MSCLIINKENRPVKKIMVETDRLVLEIIDETHMSDLIALLTNQNVHRYFPKTPDEKESYEIYERIQQKYKEDGFSYWAVFRKKDQKFIGICGLLKQIIDNREEVEVGYRLLDIYWGNGYGTEAGRGCMDYAREKLGKGSVISLIRDINKPSIRVAEKNGLVYERDTLFHGLVHGIYRKFL